MKSRIMYIECKDGGINGPARIGRVAFSRSGRTLYYGGRSFASLKGSGFKANYYDVETGEEFWISGCKKRGGDRLYSGTVEIDDDVREEYWRDVRSLPRQHELKRVKDAGKYA
ncbi:MAG: 1-deoxy-D-xylulose-5-phosphate synthase [Candidatus Hydrogenedentes bacterium]|nr:1-deoxy-D-xylulose-5-phosphate synthase [Candidatus Hydrogenedentota bacterium]